MNRVVSLLLGLNSFTILERKTLTANDRNLQYMNIKIDDEINIEDYSLLIRYKQVDGKIFADVYSIEKENDIQIPNSILEFPQTLTIEFCYISNKNDNRITIPRKLQLNVVDTYDTVIEPDDVVVGVSVADIIKEMPKKTEEGKAEIEKSKDEAIEELNKHSDSNVEESKEQINLFTSQKQEQLDTYTKTKESQLDSHTAQKKNELNTHEKAKEKELDNYVTTVNKPELDSYTNIKKEELNSHTKTKESEITQVTETKKQEITAHGASELDKFNQGAKQEADKQIGKVVAEGDVQVQRVKDESGGVIPRIEKLESGKFNRTGGIIDGEVNIRLSALYEGEDLVPLKFTTNQGHGVIFSGYQTRGGIGFKEPISGCTLYLDQAGRTTLTAENLATESKEVISAINELNSKKSDLTGSTFTGLVAVKKDTNGEAMVALNSAYGNGDIYSGGSAKGVGFKNRTSGKGLFLADDGSVKLGSTNLTTNAKEVITSINELKSEIEQLKQQIAEMQNK